MSEDPDVDSKDRRVVATALHNNDVDNDPIAPHGLIGQSWDGDGKATHGLIDDYSANEVTTDASASDVALASFEGVLLSWAAGAAEVAPWSSAVGCGSLASSSRLIAALVFAKIPS